MDSSGIGALVAMRHQGYWTGRQVPPGSDHPKRLDRQSRRQRCVDMQIEPNPVIRVAMRLLIEQHNPHPRATKLPAGRLVHFRWRNSSNHPIE